MRVLPLARRCGVVFLSAVVLLCSFVISLPSSCTCCAAFYSPPPYRGPQGPGGIGGLDPREPNKFVVAFFLKLAQDTREFRNGMKQKERSYLSNRRTVLTSKKAGGHGDDDAATTKNHQKEAGTTSHTGKKRTNLVVVDANNDDTKQHNMAQVNGQSLGKVVTSVDGLAGEVESSATGAVFDAFRRRARATTTTLSSSSTTSSENASKSSYKKRRMDLGIVSLRKKLASVVMQRELNE